MENYKLNSVATVNAMRNQFRNDSEKMPNPTKHKLAKPYFDVKDMESQDADYESEEVGNSDEEFDNTALTQFTLRRPLKPCDTSIWCKDGPLKGDTLIYKCHLTIFSQCDEDDEYLFDPSSEDEMNAHVDDTMPDGGTILSNLGAYMYEIPVCSEKKVNRVTKTITFSDHEVGFNLVRCGSTTRMLNPQFSLCDFMVPKSLGGLSYREINEINQKVLNYLSKVLGLENADKKLARLQLLRLKDTEYRSNKSSECAFDALLKEYGINKKKISGLIVWLDYLNALIFKVEASRINTNVITGLMMLKLIKHGHLTYQEAFYVDPNFLGQFPGASIATKHNFKTRAQLLTYQGFLGMKTDRKHPRWLMCTLKESIMMLNVLKVFVLKDRDANNIKRERLLKEFTKYVHEMMRTYLHVNAGT